MVGGEREISDGVAHELLERCVSLRDYHRLRAVSRSLHTRVAGDALAVATLRTVAARTLQAWWRRDRWRLAFAKRTEARWAVPYYERNFLYMYYPVYQNQRTHVSMHYLLDSTDEQICRRLAYAALYLDPGRYYVSTDAMLRVMGESYAEHWLRLMVTRTAHGTDNLPLLFCYCFDMGRYMMETPHHGFPSVFHSIRDRLLVPKAFEKLEQWLLPTDGSQEVPLWRVLEEEARGAPYAEPARDVCRMLRAAAVLDQELWHGPLFAPYRAAVDRLGS